MIKKLYDDDNLISDIYSRIYERKKSELTGYELGIHLDSFVAGLFKRGFCKLSWKLYSNNVTKPYQVNYSIINGFTFPSLYRTNNANESFGKLYDFVDEKPG